MSVCQNCGKNLNAFTEAYGLTGNADEPLCNTCKAKIEKALKGHTLTDDFVYLHKSELISKGVTENGLKHIQKAIDIKLHSAEREEAKRQEERLQKEKAEKEERERGDRAIANAGGLWEYKVVSLVDNDGGIISPDLLESTMNYLGSYGWHLKAAYANEIGRNTSSSGAYGVTTGTNATVDQNILIFERFIKVKLE